MDLVKNDPGSTTDAGCIQKSDLGIEFKLAAKFFPIQFILIYSDSSPKGLPFIE
jgi:hypothetical protein